MTASPAFPYSELADKTSIDEGGHVACKRSRPDDERGSYRSGLMEFRSEGEKPRKKTEPERLYSADDLVRAVDDAKRAAAAETETALRETMAKEIEQRRCKLLAAIQEQLEQRRSAFEQELSRLAGVSQELALALARAVIPQAIERHPLADIADSLKATLARLTTEPSIELRLASDLVESGERLLTELAREAGFTGEITTIADPALGDGDVVLRWKGGAVNRRLDRLQAEVSDLVDRWLQEFPETTEDQVAPPHTPPETAMPDPLSDPMMDAKSANERVTS